MCRAFLGAFAELRKATFRNRIEITKTTNWTRGNSCKRNLTEPAYMVRPCSENDRRKITQNSIEVDAETKESTRKTEEKLDGRYKEGHERKRPK